MRVNGALMAVSHDQTFLEAIGVERGDHSLAKHSAVKVSFGSRLCENSLEPRTRRIVFSIVFSQEKSPVQSVSTTTKLRQKIRAGSTSEFSHSPGQKETLSGEC